MVFWSSLRHQQPGIDSFLRLRLSQIKAVYNPGEVLNMLCDG
jgi:hypothetical protein